MRHEEAKQVGYKNVEVPTGKPADLVTLSVTIGLAILRPFVGVFFHKKAQASRDRVRGESLSLKLFAGSEADLTLEMQMEAQIHKKKLRVVEAHAERLRVSEEALKECSSAFATATEIMYGRVNEHATNMVTAQRMQPGSEARDDFEDDLDILCSELKICLDSQRDFDVQVRISEYLCNDRSPN